MNKNIGPTNRWENYEMRPGGSMIITSPSNHQTGLSPKPVPKYKLDDLFNRQMLARHSSEEEFKRFNQRLNLHSQH